MKQVFVKRILAMVMMVMLLAGDLVPSLADTVSDGDVVEVNVPAKEPIVNPEEEIVGEDDSVNANDSTETEETQGENVPAENVSEEETPVDESEVVITEEETPAADAPVEEEVVEEDSTVEESVSDSEVTVSDGDAEVEEVVEDTIVALESVTVDGVTITVSGPASAFAEGTTVSAVAVEPAEVVIEAAEENEQAVVKKYKAFDINLVHNGEFVQPLGGAQITVNFEGDILIPDADEDVAVYHVDEDDNVTKMEAEVAPLEVEEETVAEETVAMETTHFSVYVIVVTAEITDQKVTFKHYLGTPANRKEIYAPSEIVVHKGEDEIFKSEIPVQGGANYTMTQFVVSAEGKDSVTYINDVNSNAEEVIELLATENVIEIYYKENAQSYTNETTFFDYYIDSFEDGEQLSDAGLYQNTFVSFTYNGRRYTEWKVENRDEGIISKDGRRIDLKEGDILTNVDIQGGGKFDKVVFQNKYFYAAEWVEDTYTVYNGGINAGATEPFLSMGLSKPHAQLAMPWSVTSYYNYTITKNGTAYNFNTNTSNSNGVEDGQNAIITGIVERLTGNNYDTLVMGMTDQGVRIQEPGYFDNTVSDDKAIYENYSLVFNQTGNTYELNYAVNNDNGNKTYSYTSENVLNRQFLPLNDAPIIGGRDYYQPTYWLYEPDFNEGNYYFGMRYDFNFSVGDYIGPLEYMFEGDDDLWVFVDGKLVLDLGGMHSAYPGRYATTPEDNVVDLWKAVYGVDTTQENWYKALTAEQKAQKHQVTILYMERGAYESTCAMKFVIPNVEAKAPVVSRIPKTDLEIAKKNSKTHETIANVGFTLYADAACTQIVQGELFTGSTGLVKFTGLKEGTYYLKETTFPAGYLVNDTVYTVKVTANGECATAVVEGAELCDCTYKIYNTPIPTINLNFKKVEHGNLDNVLAGAEFTLTSESDASFKMTAVSDSCGNFTFENVPEGVYYLTETKAPEGFVLPNDSWIVRVSAFEGTDSDSYWAHGTVYDECAGLQYRINGGEGPTGLWQACQSGCFMYIKNDRPVNFEFTKVDAETKAPMKDVEFTLYSDLSAEMTAKVATAVSTADGKVVFENLADGNYLLVESPVEGYVAAGPWILSVVNNDGKYTLTLYDAEYIEPIRGYAIVQGSAYETMVIENTPDKPEVGSLVITKTVDEVNMVHGEATFTFKIEGPEGEVLYRTITFDTEVTNGASKSVTISNLPVGTYKVTELTTLRYKCVNAEQSKEVVADQTTGFDFYNEKVFDNYYSHSDVKVNVVTFERDADGNITGSNISQKITSDNN